MEDGAGGTAAQVGTALSLSLSFFLSLSHGHTHTWAAVVAEPPGLISMSESWSMSSRLPAPGVSNCHQRETPNTLTQGRERDHDH